MKSLVKGIDRFRSRTLVSVGSDRLSNCWYYPVDGPSCGNRMQIGTSALHQQ